MHFNEFGKHSGFRGTARNISRKMSQIMSEVTGKEKKGSWHASPVSQQSWCALWGHSFQPAKPWLLKWNVHLFVPPPTFSSFSSSCFSLLVSHLHTEYCLILTDNPLSLDLSMGRFPFCKCSESRTFASSATSFWVRMNVPTTKKTTRKKSRGDPSPLLLRAGRTP